MKVLHLISSLKHGGRERQLATIYKYSDKNRVSNKILCFNRTPSSYIVEYDLTNDLMFLATHNPYKRLVRIKRAIRESKADIVWSWGGIEAAYAMLISFTSNSKHINGSIRHGIVRFNTHQLWRMIILHLSKNIVANSRAGLIANKLNRGLVFYNGIDSKFFVKPDKKSSVTRQELGVGDDIILLASVANLVPYKDYDSILKALCVLKEKRIPFHYIAIGDGPERNRIGGLVEKMNLSQDVSFLGSRNDCKDILYASDIFIHSSRGEGCSNAILEAMAAGLPIIASATGGTSEVVDISNGRLFAFKNVEQLAKEIEDLIRNKSVREELGRNSKIKAQRDFSIEKMMSNYYKLIDDIMR